ncbi:MAG: Sec-independent protein translocase protein TatB [Pseudomonadota bacterium]
MLDIGWTELLLIGIVALIVVGPKDLPGMFKALGRFTARARNMAREFQRAMNEAADQSGVKETADGLKGLTSPKKMGLDSLNKAADSFEKWQPGKPATPPAPKKEEGAATAALRAERVAEANRIQEATAKRLADAKAAREAPVATAASAHEPFRPRERDKPARNRPVKKPGARRK